MANISKIQSVATTSISKILGSSYSDISKVSGSTAPQAASFSDSYSVSKSITTGTGQAVYIADSNGSYRFDHNDPFTVSFWIKAGWTINLNTNIHLFSSSDVSATGANADTFRIWYVESNNRLYAEWRSGSTAKKQNFWLFHSNSGNYAAAYAASGLLASYWSNTNRGNANADGYTLITVTRGTTNSGASSNLKLYWNGTDCGVGFYASGGGSGTPAMGNTTDKQVALGSDSWNFAKSGDTNETKFNGVTIWDKVLSSAEVTELYNSGAPMDVSGHSAYGANCVGWWNFESDGSNEVEGGPDFTIAGNSNTEAK
jgi:hypothetical protein